jgi:prenyltransferase beta subunit
VSLRLALVQVARLAPNVLGDATPLVAEFLQSQRTAEGGFADRAGRSDLYYTVFGLESLLALRQPLPLDDLHRYLQPFGAGGDLDFIHAACLVRCWSLAATRVASGALRSEAVASRLTKKPPFDAILDRLESCRTPDGGYDTLPGKSQGSLYATFMAVGAYQDCQREIPEFSRLLDFIRSLRDSDGGYRQSRELPMSLVPITAGAVTLLKQFGDEPIDPATMNWLMSCWDEQGGFRPAPAAPMPDLLSTATALHALSAGQIDLGARKEACLDFVDSLWTNRGGFYGHWEDTHVDCEYTWYALLALGHLSL